MSPGPVIPNRLWIDQSGLVAMRFAADSPVPLSAVGACEALAQWLVLLDKWMDTHIVLANARVVWSLAELAGALPYTSPGMLPRPLAQLPYDNRERVARGLAAIVIEGCLPGNRNDSEEVM